MRPSPHQLIAVLLAVATALSAATARAEPGGGHRPPAFPPLAADERPFSAQEWRKLTDGKTLYYREWGRFTGRERYFAGTDQVIFARTENRGCVSGTYDHRLAPRGGGVFCFYWDTTVCFQHFRRNGQIIARRADGGEAVIFKITDERVVCEAEPIS